MEGVKEPDQPTTIVCGRDVRAQLDYSGGCAVIGGGMQRWEGGTMLK